MNDLEDPLSPKSQHPPRTGTDPVLARWHSIIAEYSSLSFYDPTDNHAAMSGIAIVVHEVIAKRFGEVYGRPLGEGHGPWTSLGEPQNPGCSFADAETTNP